jgi:hypothetical protein
VRSVVAQPAQRIAALSGDVAHAAWERARAAHDAVAVRAGDDPTPAAALLAVAGAAPQGFRRDARSGRMAHDGHGGVRYLRRLAPDQLPPTAHRMEAREANAGRLLRQGHHLQYNDDGTVDAWLPHEAQDASVPPNAQGAPSPAAGPGGTPDGALGGASTSPPPASPPTPPHRAGGTLPRLSRRRSARPHVRRRPGA